MKGKPVGQINRNGSKVAATNKKVVTRVQKKLKRQNKRKGRMQR